MTKKWVIFWIMNSASGRRLVPRRIRVDGAFHHSLVECMVPFTEATGRFYKWQIKHPKSSYDPWIIGKGQNLIDWLIDRFVDWLIGSLIDWLVDWFLDSLIDWLIGALIAWLIDWKWKLLDEIWNVDKLRCHTVFLVLMGRFGGIADNDRVTDVTLRDGLICDHLEALVWDDTADFGRVHQEGLRQGSRI